MKLDHLVLAAFLMVSACTNTAPSLNGRWEITREAGASPISALSDEEIQATIGKQVTVSEQSLEFNSMKCLNPKIQVSKISVQQFFDEYRIERLNDLDKAATAVEISCEKGSSPSPLVLSSETLLFVLDGVLFEASRLK